MGSSSQKSEQDCIFGTELAEALLFLQVPAGTDSVLNFNLWSVEG